MSVLPHGEFFGKLKERQAKFFFGNTKGVGSEEGGDAVQSKNQPEEYLSYKCF